MARGLLIQPNGDHDFREIGDYTDIQAAVGGNFDFAGPGPVTYYCYEYALFERQVNPVASQLYMDTHHTEDLLAGPVLVMGPPVDDDDTDVPETFVAQAQGLIDNVGADEIARLAQPLTPAAQLAIHTKMAAAHNKATAALKQGKSVDFGGIMLGPPAAKFDHDPTTEEVNNLFNTLFGEQVDGNRRKGRMP